jgi:broad specificity phosphatase PhoE
MRIRRFTHPWLLLSQAPQLLDPPLTEKGRKQAAEARDRERQRLLEVDLFVCSPLLRAVQTMQIMTEGVLRPVIMTPLVSEVLRTASDTGSTYAELKLKYPEYNLANFDEEVWWRHDADKAVNEDNADVLNRVIRLVTLFTDFGANKAAVFTHGDFIRHYANRTFMPRPCQRVELIY